MGGLKRYQMFIDGQWVDAGDGKTFESHNPTTGEAWAEIPEATADDVDRAVKAAHRAFSEGEWANALPTARGKYLRRLADLLAEKSEELGRIETIDTGKMLKETRWQAKYIAEFFHFYAGAADKVMGHTLPIDKPDMWAMTMREPLGVIAAVVPWNSQLFLAAVKIGPALAAGNTVVLKASEICLGSHARIRQTDRGGGLSPRRLQRRDRPWRAVRPGADLASAGGPHQLHRRPRRRPGISSTIRRRILPRSRLNSAASRPSSSLTMPISKVRSMARLPASSGPRARAA